jgi:hypothetical protein
MRYDGKDGRQLMYFSHNVTYYFKQKDPNDRSKGGTFFSSDQMAIIREKEEEKTQQKNDEFIHFLGQEFTEEEIEFLKNNWTPPTSQI